MIAANVAIAAVSDPVDARPLFVTPAACFLACSAFCFLASAAKAGFGLRLVRVGLLDRGFRIRLVPGGGLGQLVGGIDLRLRGVDRRVRLVHRRLGGGLGGGGGSNAGGDGQGDPGKTPDTSKPAASPKPAGTADDGQAAGAAPLASTGAGTGPAIAVAGLLAMAGASLLAAVARTRRHGADPDGLTAD